MQSIWQLQTAKNKLSEVIDRAVESGPQTITRHGESTAVVLSMKDYLKLSARKGSISGFLSNSPLRGSNITMERSRDLPREVEL